MKQKYDYVIVGSGISGLCTGAILASEGKKVCLIEKHFQIGGYGQTFEREGYVFNSAMHYLFNCIGEDADIFLKKTKLDKTIQFKYLDKNAFDKLYFPKNNYEFSIGFDENCEKLSEKFPKYSEVIRKYFKIIYNIWDQMYRLPLGFSVKDLELHPIKFKDIIKYQKYTTDDLFDELDMPLKLRAILCGQFPNMMISPRYASLVMHAGNTGSYINGACVPKKGLGHFFKNIGKYIEKQKGCDIKINSQVVGFETIDDKVSAVCLKKGDTILADQFIYNGDPKILLDIVDKKRLSQKVVEKFRYDYSASSFMIYLGIEGIDLRKFGFGDCNVIYYPSNNINAIYEKQIKKGDMSDVFYFIGTPNTTKTKSDKKTTMLIATGCRADYFDKFIQKGRKYYLAEKKRIARAIIDGVEKKFIPSLKKHIKVMETGTPNTNQRFVMAPQGNCYGAALTPENIKVDRIKYYDSPWENLFLLNATISAPGFGGGVHAGMQLAEILIGKKLLERR